MKRLVIMISLVLTLAVAVPGLVLAAATDTSVKLFQEKKLVKSVVFAIGVNKYWVDGKETAMDVKPFVESDRTFVPIRFLSNALGVPDERISWEDETKTVTMTSWKHVRMTVGSKWIATRSADNYVGESHTVDVAPILKETEGRTYLPARYVAEALGYEVDWDEASQTVLCWPKGEAKPDASAVIQKAVEERARLEGKQPEQQQNDKPQAPPGYKVTSMGYVVPENTKLEIEDRKETGDPEKDRQIGVNLTILIWLPSSEYARKRLPQDQWTTTEDFDTEFRQAEDILAGKHGQEVSKTVVEYARLKTSAEQVLETRDFPLETGGEIRVMSKYSTPYITISVWR